MNTSHWTMQSLCDFAYWVASDFTAQIESKLEVEGIGKNDFANRVGVSASRVSQVLNDPGNLTLGNTVKYARALGMKVALVMYDDADPDNDKGPITADVFTKCWERLGKPKDLFEFQDVKESNRVFIVYKNTAATVENRRFEVKCQESASTAGERGRCA
jgi:transcriptional regulator with XRE-family HTH domain